MSLYFIMATLVGYALWQSRKIDRLDSALHRAAILIDTLSLELERSE